MEQEIANELTEIGSSLGSVPREMPYAVPEGYATHLEERMRDLVSAESGSHAGLPKEMPYTAPEGYFDRLPQTVVEQTVNKRPRGVLISFTQLRWAAAAVLFVAVGLGAYDMMNNISHPADGLLSSVADREIREYLAYNYHTPAAPPATHNDLLDNMDIDTKDIITYLDDTGWDLDSDQ